MTAGYLLDTCVISEFVRSKPHAGLIDWFRSIEDSTRLFLSAVTIGELQKGIEKLGSSEKAKRLQKWFDEDIVEWFDGRILPFDANVAHLWGRLTARCEKMGHPRPTLDSQISAIASAHNLTLVTRNVSDMEGMGVEILNPWDLIR